MNTWGKHSNVCVWGGGGRDVQHTDVLFGGVLYISVCIICRDVLDSAGDVYLGGGGGGYSMVVRYMVNALLVQNPRLKVI